MTSEKNNKKNNKKVENRSESALDVANHILVDDLLGREDLKKSWVGYVTGGSVIKNTATSAATNAVESLSRTGNLVQRVFLNKEDIAGLDHDKGSPEERFAWAMQLHRKTDKDMKVMIANTYKASILYGALILLSIVIGSFSMYHYKATGLIDVLTRFIPLYVVVPLLLKNAMANYMFRNRRLVSIIDYLRSGDLIPKK